MFEVFNSSAEGVEKSVETKQEKQYEWKGEERERERLMENILSFSCPFAHPWIHFHPIIYSSIYDASVYSFIHSFMSRDFLISICQPFHLPSFQLIRSLSHWIYISLSPVLSTFSILNPFICPFNFQMMVLITVHQRNQSVWRSVWYRRKKHHSTQLSNRLFIHHPFDYPCVIHHLCKYCLHIHPTRFPPVLWLVHRSILYSSIQMSSTESHPSITYPHWCSALAQQHFKGRMTRALKRHNCNCFYLKPAACTLFWWFADVDCEGRSLFHFHSSPWTSVLSL